ncbi:MAG: zinc ribbon domain-containing protein [Proteobacteria bacterium]|nr:zinc ribbon domain-containing protein [Pseudomonadota bacterium]NDC23515.1 zinc ribbon domain-containing protein [Pseudomonadota bacterium]NDG27407.1 zinc ribbon domain-containing protein [Pseudomonadota bacterium]
MPLYEYDCSGCKKRLEMIQKFSDSPLNVCPDCGSTLTKAMSLGSFQLKGFGWYNTDYKTSNQPGDTTGKSSSDSNKGGCGSGSCANS